MSLNDGIDTKSLVLQATDIVELIGQSVALKRVGRKFLGLCPFHQEKTPSFNVDPQKQYFHCFGCKAGGNAIDFVIKRDRVEFLDALRILAERAKIDLPKRGGQDKQKAGERQLLFDAQSAACGVFEAAFNHPELGRIAREYMAKRGFNEQTLKQFRVGLAVDSWDALAKSPAMRKFPPAVLAAAGLVKPRQKGDGFYDTFRNRVMFPIMEEAQARIIAFGGRVMPGSEDPAKYLNSPETPLFSKSKSIYGLNFARQRMIETGVAVVVEGYTDVAMAHQYGASNVISILGTAMTEQHVNLLRRFAKKIVLLFDADEAGDTAVDRSVELFLTKEMEIGIASMPEGVDPDEYVMQHGAEGFDQLVGQAKDVLTYKWEQMSHTFRDAGDDLTGQQRAVESYLGLLAKAREAGPIDNLRWWAVLSRVSRLTGIPDQELNRRFSKGSKGRSFPAQPAPASPEAEAPVIEEPEVPVEKDQELAERQMLGILLKEPSRWHRVCSLVHPADFQGRSRRRLAELYWQHQQDIGEPVFNEFLALLESPADKETALRLMEFAEELSEVDVALDGAIKFLEESKQRERQQKHIAELRRISQQNAAPEVQEQLFEAFLKNNPTSDLKRLGPVRRFRSGS